MRRELHNPRREMTIMTNPSKLDGMTVVNLAEPSKGDLERVYKAYLAERERAEKYKAALERIVGTVEKFTDFHGRTHVWKTEASRYAREALEL